MPRKSLICKNLLSAAGDKALGSLPEQDLRVNDDFGNFKLLRKLGSGGQCVVFKAVLNGTRNIAALKTFRRLPDPGVRRVAFERFKREHRIASQLDHPNIVKAYDAAIDPATRRPYFTMEFINGADLGRRIARMVKRATGTNRAELLPPGRLAALFETVALAMFYAHGQGVLHRDLKPSNILIDRNDQPHIADFGVAKRVDETSDLTLANQPLGTANYMSPEAFFGDASQRSDIYSFGATLYHALYGILPFRDKNAGQPFKTVPRELEAICKRCLEDRPADRYEDFRKVAAALWRFQNRRGKELINDRSFPEAGREDHATQGFPCGDPGRPAALAEKCRVLGFAR